MVRSGVSSREDTDIIEGGGFFVSKTISALFVCSAVCMALLSTACSNRPSASRGSAKGKTAPEFALKDANGQTVHLADYKGKVVLLDFWATWCGPCKIEIPWFMDFEQTYKDKNFAVLGVSLDEDGWSAVKPYIDGRRINYRVMVGNDDVAQLYGAASLPTTFIIDRSGRIAATHVGLCSKGEYEADVKAVLNEQ